MGWIVIALVTDSMSFKYMAFSKYTWVALSWPCSIFLLSLVDWADFSPYQFTIVLVVSAFVYYAKGNHVKALRFLIAVYVAYAIMISAFSIQQLQINPEISRILANSDKNITSAFAGPFMANFSFVNGLMLVSLFWVFNFKTTHNKRIRLFSLLMVVIGVYLLVCAQYSIALYKLSISTFFHNFFIGVGGKYYGANGLVGGHSQILDNFAYYGVLFGSQFVWYLTCVYKNGAAFLQNDFRKIYRTLFVVYMIQCLLNTSYNEEMLFTIFFI